MTMNKYLKFEADKERRLRRNVRSKRSPTKYDGADFKSFHRDKIRTFNYMYYPENIKINMYHDLPPLYPYFQYAEPYNEDGLVSFNESDNVDTNRLRKARQLLTPTVNIFLESDYVVKQYVPLSLFLDEVKVVRKEEPDNDIDIISIQVPYVMDTIIQPLIPQPIHVTPPNKYYVALTSRPILDELLEEFKDEIFNITVVEEEVEELERLIATDHESSSTKIKDRATIAKSSTLPRDSAPRVTSPAAKRAVQIIKGIGTEKMRKNDNIQQNPHYGRSYGVIDTMDYAVTKLMAEYLC
nr:hypothetical protein [Tanacetum cinerariifolium]